MRSFASGVLLVLASMALPAQGGLYRDIYRGLGILATPSGSPLLSASDGTRVNGQRTGRLRIVPDSPGRGYSVEFNRTFGNDSEGRPEVLDLGGFEMQLSGATQATLGFTRRGGLVGNANVTANSLNYALRGKSGAQDIALTGTLNIQSSLEVNALGFYTLSTDVSNTNSQLTMDGVAVQNFQQPTNFDIGPINVKGNIFVDGLTAVLAQAGVDTTPLQQLFPESPLTAIIQSLEQQMTAATQVAGLQVTSDGQLPPVPPGFGQAAGQTVLAGLQAPVVTAGSGTPGLVPEPGTLLLLCLGGLMVRWGRR